MTIQEAKNKLFGQPDQLAFLLGNGINRYYNQNNTSWYQFLLETWNKICDEKRDTIPEGISITEFYDTLELQHEAPHQSTKIEKFIKNQMQTWTPSEHPNLMLDGIKALNAPILTTNFDDLISQYLKLKLHRIKGTRFTHYYPWSSYYAAAPLSHLSDGFGLWHMHGMIHYHTSIKLGLSHYMGNVHRARNLIHNKKNSIYRKQKNTDSWAGSKTWLELLFHKDLIIIGLGMNEVEVFVRWLLIERARYFKRFPKRRFKAYYIDINNHIPGTTGKEMFLQAVGVEPIKFPTYDHIYYHLWEN